MSLIFHLNFQPKIGTYNNLIDVKLFFFFNFNVYFVIYLQFQGKTTELENRKTWMTKQSK